MVTTSAIQVLILFWRDGVNLDVMKDLNLLERRILPVQNKESGHRISLNASVSI